MSDGGPAKAPPTLRRRLLWAVAALWLAVALFGLLPPWLRHRAQQAAEAQAELIEQSLANPGVVLFDPALPAGTLAVTLVPAAPGLVLEEAATIRVDHRSYAWTPEARGRFHDLAAATPYPISVAGPYAIEPITVTLPAGSPGARLAVRAIPLDPLRVSGVDYEVGVTPEKRLEVDMTRPDQLQVLWFQGYTLVSEFELPRGEVARASGLPLYPALAARVVLEWKMQANHMDPSDRKLDQAVVRALPGTPFDDLLAVTASILAHTRVLQWPGERRDVPAFHVSVQPPRPPLPAFVLDRGEGEPDGSGPRVQLGAIQVSGQLPPVIAERLVKRHLGSVQRCYEVGLGWNPGLAGRVAVRVAIGADGAAAVSNAGSDLADAATVQCIVGALSELSFSRPDGAALTVVVPFALSPGRRRH